jgi:putative ABC transport system permease protein
MRTYLTLLGIMIGISAIVFLVSFAFGIEKLVTSEITGGDAFKLIDVGTGNSQVIKLNDDAIKDLDDLAYSNSIETTFNMAGKAIEGDRTMDVAFFAASSKYIEWSGYRPKAGKVYSDSDVDKIVVNTAYLDFIKIKSAEEAISKKVILDVIVPKELMDSEESLTLSNQEYEIVGVVENGTSPNIFSSHKIILPHAKNYSQAKVEITAQDQVLELRKQIEAMGFKTQYVGDTVSQIEQIFNVFKLILGSFGLIALVVASLGMFNTLTISLLERMREVALLKILGTQRKDISRLFMVEALIFGAIGGVLGIALGVITGQVFNVFLNRYAVQSGGDPVRIFYYPAWFILAILAFALMVGVLTGIYPSRRAAKVKSLDVIRYE